MVSKKRRKKAKRKKVKKKRRKRSKKRNKRRKRKKKNRRREKKRKRKNYDKCQMFLPMILTKSKVMDYFYKYEAKNRLNKYKKSNK